MNRTNLSYALAIVAAEYVLEWVPRGTHDWNKFLTPEEVTGYVREAGLELSDLTGLVYNPLCDRWSLHPTDTNVNYFLTTTKPSNNDP